MAEREFDCVVIGSGPGGYVAAIRAAQLELRTAVVERETVGGICLNWGCIPTKALLKSASVYTEILHAKDYGLSAENIQFDFPAVVDRSRGVVDRMTKGVQFLFRKNKIELINGSASFVDRNTVSVSAPGKDEERVRFKNAIIAVGARAKTIPALPIDGDRILNYRHALALKQRPNRILVIGAGAIGVEFAYFYRTFGAEVTLVEMLDQILPIEDEEVAKTLTRSFEKAGMQISTSTSVVKLWREGDAVRATLKKGEQLQEWVGDACLVAIGIQGNIENLGLEAIGITPERSFIPVNASYQTGAPNVYAIGDIIEPPWLAHVASHEGIIAAETIAGLHPHPLDYKAIPGCTYCIPQVASIGLTEKAAREQGRKYKTGKFPFSASGKAVASNETEGFVKVIVDPELEEILGIHIVHPEATELMGEGTLIMSHEGVASSVFNTVHAHPTLSESVMEAMGDALGRAIHI